ncbi:GRAM domain-containing protein 2B-like isoform X1 [Microplitis mediator]|uniref:GRAM domain-containing protein 2B-like isoform X1 n=1 Tax=Microplitis mediator TaxID=375433 RepID=UPI0025543504|nr:GRAM domain-containing protein 2B-like isoform X1 [Microplitis mediator]XP_057331431.1 GRAM domain-containing protein 2B-like isoform X1 [Microplitis mediator]
MSGKESRRKSFSQESRSRQQCKSTPNLTIKIKTSSTSSSLSVGNCNLAMMPPNEDICDNNNDVLRRGNSLRLPFLTNEEESGSPLRRGGSLNLKRLSEQDVDGNRLRLPGSTILGSIINNNGVNEESCSIRPARYSAPALVAPAPEQLAISLLQLGCPLVSMPRPRGGVGSENTIPHSSDSDDSISSHNNHRSQRHHTSGNTSPEGYGLPKVQISGPGDNCESSSINESAGSIGARSAPSTPLQPTVGPGPQSPTEKQHSICGSQLTVGSVTTHLPPKSPSHVSLQKCHDSQLSKPLSRSTPSMTAGGGSQTPSTISRSSTRSSPTSTSSARQKKFHRHFTQSSKFHDQVGPDERVINYYSCALVGDILLQGHLYITSNYFAFHSNVFGYVTKLLIPTSSVLKISKEKTARIIPNAIAIVTEDERHVFCSLLSRDSTFKLMKQVWDAALEGRETVDDLPLPVDVKLLTPDSLLVDDSEVNVEEDDSSMSESGTDLTSRPPTVCTDTDGMTPIIPRPILTSPRLELTTMPKNVTTAKVGIIRSLLKYQLRSRTIITILVALLAALYVSAAFMMVRIDRLHTAYLNHPLASPERFTHDRLLNYLNTNLDQIVKVRQSLQTLSQQFVTLNQDSGSHDTVHGSGKIEPEDAPS